MVAQSFSRCLICKSHSGKCYHFIYIIWWCLQCSSLYFGTLQSFDSPQVKRHLISSSKAFVYGLSHWLLKNLRLRKLWNYERSKYTLQKTADNVDIRQCRTRSPHRCAFNPLTAKAATLQIQSIDLHISIYPFLYDGNLALTEL